MTANLELWNKVNQPPASALKQIKGGRLKGKTDISPQWRYKALTEAFGPCGIGWKYTIEKLWLEPGNGSEVFAFATISLFVLNLCEGQWAEPIPGIGGSKLVVQESGGPHNNDEAYKMAVTDALSTACKMLGVGADVYMGRWDGSKYLDKPAEKAPNAPQKGTGGNAGDTKQMSAKQWEFIKSIGAKCEPPVAEMDIVEMVKWKAESMKVSPRHWTVARAILGDSKKGDVSAEVFLCVLLEWEAAMEGAAANLAKEVILDRDDDIPY